MGIIRAIKSHNLKKKVRNMTPEQVNKEIIIQGTLFDRKRILDNDDIKTAKKYIKKGYSWKQIGELLDVDPRTIRYSMDAEYRLRRIMQSPGTHTGVANFDAKNRANYKLELVFSGAYVK